MQRPDLISGVPRWTADPNLAGGKRINKAAFGVQNTLKQGDLGRNALRRFGATQVGSNSMSAWYFRPAPTFSNIFNYPNFGNP